MMLTFIVIDNIMNIVDEALEKNSYYAGVV